MKSLRDKVARLTLVTQNQETLNWTVVVMWIRAYTYVYPFTDTDKHSARSESYVHVTRGFRKTRKHLTIKYPVQSVTLLRTGSRTIHANRAPKCRDPSKNRDSDTKYAIN
jgi:hypothetical protein